MGGRGAGGGRVTGQPAGPSTPFYSPRQLAAQFDRLMRRLQGRTGKAPAGAVAANIMRRRLTPAQFNMLSAHVRASRAAARRARARRVAGEGASP